MNIIYIILVVFFALFLFLMIMNTRKKKNGSNKIIQIDDNKCARCRSCINRCRHDVLEMVNDGNGTHIEVKNPDQCVGCGHCIEVCRFGALTLVNRNAND